MHPYSNLPAKAYWKRAVGAPDPSEIHGLWDPRFDIGQRERITTFGSCFAQHIGRALLAHGFRWKSYEPTPMGFPEDLAHTYGYDVFSARTGNIYTTSLLNQWTRWALTDDAPPDEVWESDKGRFYDPFRPAIEPNGFASKDEMVANRRDTIKAFRRCIENSDYFVFTLGLTESWWHTTKAYEYPVCPGTAAGEFDGSKHVFRNQRFPEIFDMLEKAISLMRTANENLKFLLTVSPVPLTATMSDNHVLVATMESKSILRAVAGAMRGQYDFVDYFPSYEIVSSPVFGGAAFEDNKRSVSRDGVDAVMTRFFADLTAKYGTIAVPVADAEDLAMEIFCEEEYLDGDNT